MRRTVLVGAACAVAILGLARRNAMAGTETEDLARRNWKAVREAAARLPTAKPNVRLIVDRAGRARPVGADPRSRPLAMGEMLVEHTSGPAQKVANEAGTIGWLLPTRIRMDDTSGHEVTVVPWIAVQGGGLRWAQAAGAFQGTILVALVEAGGAPGDRHLSAPVAVQLTGDATRYTPSAVSLDHTNAPFVDVLVEDESPEDTVRVSAYAAITRDPVAITVPVLREKVRVEPTPERIQGFGLEVAHLVVTGPPSTGGRPSMVTLTGDLASPEPQNVALDRSGRGEAVIRSRGVGRATVRADASPAGFGEARIEFQTPWAFGAAALVGGLVGAIITVLRTASKARRKPRRGKTAITLGLGVLIGGVVATAYAVGVKLLDIEAGARTGEALVFVLAALGAVVGPRVFSPIGPAER